MRTAQLVLYCAVGRVSALVLKGVSVMGRRLFRHAPSFSGPHLFCQLVFVFSRCLLQFCDTCLLLLHHGAQVLNAIVIWQLIFGHLQAAVQSGVRENRLFNRTCVLTASSVTERCRANCLLLTQPTIFPASSLRFLLPNMLPI